MMAMFGERLPPSTGLQKDHFYLLKNMMQKEGQTDHQETEHTQNEPGNPSPRHKRRQPWTILLVIPFILAIILAWMYFPILQQVVVGTPTPPPETPTLTPTITRTPTTAPTSTITPTITATPMPPSAYRVTDMINIYPPIPQPAMEAYVLDEQNSVTADPDFSYPQWYSSDVIAQQLGISITEKYFATIGPGSATWSMDASLAPGLYQLFILDTVYSSAGSLDFQVLLGDRLLSPISGVQHVEYSTTSGTPRQVDDQWHSIGIYNLDSIAALKIQTSWEARDNSSIVAIDRALITRLPGSSEEFLEKLPANGNNFVVDDEIVAIESSDMWYKGTDQPAWGDQFQVLVNPVSTSKVTWEVPDAVPPGQYEALVWIPQIKGNSEVTYRLLVNGAEQSGVVVIETANMPASQWVSLGTWNVNSNSDAWVHITLQMEIAAGSTGEFAVDAAAFIKKP